MRPSSVTLQHFSAQELLDFIAMVPMALFVELNGVPLERTATCIAHQQSTDFNNPFTNVVQSPANLYVDFGIDPTLGTGEPLDAASHRASITPFVVNGFWVGLGSAAARVPRLRFGGTREFPGFGDVFSQDNCFTILVAPSHRHWRHSVWPYLVPGLVDVWWRAGAKLRPPWVVRPTC